MDHTFCASCENIRIRPLHENDIELLRMWRNDPDNSVYLSPIDIITPLMQKNWFESYLQDAQQLIFAIEETRDLHRMVGSVSIYGLCGSCAEIGKIIVGDRDAHGRKAGYYGMILAACVGFRKLGVSTFRLNVHENNEPARVIYHRMGFQPVGDHAFEKGGIEIEMELTKNDFNTISAVIPIRL